MLSIGTAEDQGRALTDNKFQMADWTRNTNTEYAIGKYADLSDNLSSEALAKEEALSISRAKLPVVGEVGRHKTERRQSIRQRKCLAMDEMETQSSIGIWKELSGGAVAV
jgi:hypothetical protein